MVSLIEQCFWKTHPLLWCIFQEGHTDTIKTLLQLGADLHARDKKGRSGKTFSHLYGLVKSAPEFDLL